jgi:hypothetical protein
LVPGCMYIKYSCWWATLYIKKLRRQLREGTLIILVCQMDGVSQPGIQKVAGESATTDSEMKDLCWR